MVDIGSGETLLIYDEEFDEDDLSAISELQGHQHDSPQKPQPQSQTQQQQIPTRQQQQISPEQTQRPATRVESSEREQPSSQGIPPHFNFVKMFSSFGMLGNRND